MAFKKKQKKVKKNRKGPRVSFGEKLTKVLMVGFKVALVVVAVPAVFYGGLKLYHELYSSAHLEVKSIEVSGISRVTTEEVLELSNIQNGQNIISVDNDEAVTGIEGHPWIRSATVRRDMPDTVKIEVTERDALVYVLMDKLYVADSTGELFKRYSPDDTLDLPVVTGLEMKAGNEDYRIEKDVMGIIDYLKTKEGFGMADIAEINVDDFSGITLYTDPGGVRLDLGNGGIVGKLSDFEKVLDKRGGKLTGVAMMDLSNERGVVVKLNSRSNKKGGGRRNG